MSEITLQMLFDVDTNAIGRASAAWLRMAHDLDAACDEFIRGSRGLDEVWPSGTAAEAAVRRSGELRAESSNAEPPCRRIGDALRVHADTLRSLQNQVEAIAAEASGRGFQVDVTTGSVSAPARMITDSASAQYVSQQVVSYVNEFRAILGQAVSSDDSCANAIRVNLPDAKTGFGRSSLPPVTEQTLREQAGRTPAQVRDWWESLTPDQQDRAIQDHPDLVGWLDGVPATDRDQANRITLEQNIKDLRAHDAPLADREAYLKSMAAQHRLAEVYPDSANPVGAAQAELSSIKDQREQIAGTLNGATDIDNRSNDPSRPPVFLLGYDPHGDGKAIVSVGNPDLAGNVVTYVPGTMADLPKIKGDMERADTMADDAAKLDRYKPTAAITYLGYDAPDFFTNAGSGSYAENGAADLRDFQAGLRATHDGDTPAHNTIIGHSYGSTAVGYAARDGHLDVNDVIFVGSPGVGADQAKDLHIDGGAGNVWASTAANDVIRLTGIDDTMRFGENPDNPGFGGRQFTSAHGSLDPVATHSQYWDRENPSRANIAKIITGNYSEVS